MTIKMDIRERVAELYSTSPNMTQKEVADYFGIGRDTVLKILLEFGITPRTYTGDRSMVRRIRNFEFDFFDRRDKVVAYWAGFFIADGHIHVGNTGGASLICYVDSKDAWHMQKFYDDIRYQEPLKYRKDGYVGFELHYSRFKQQLPPWGIVPNKTKRFVAPTCLNREMLPHFLRGWIDGDGNLYVSGRGARLSIASGNGASMEWFADALRYLGYSGNIGVRKANRFSDNWVLYIGGTRQISQVSEILQSSVEFCMPRKWKTSSLY